MISTVDSRTQPATGTALTLRSPGAVHDELDTLPDFSEVVVLEHSEPWGLILSRLRSSPLPASVSTTAYCTFGASAMMESSRTPLAPGPSSRSTTGTVPGSDV